VSSWSKKNCHASGASPSKASGLTSTRLAGAAVSVCPPSPAVIATTPVRLPGALSSNLSTCAWFIGTTTTTAPFHPAAPHTLAAFIAAWSARSAKGLSRCSPPRPMTIERDPWTTDTGP